MTPILFSTGMFPRKWKAPGPEGDREQSRMYCSTQSKVSLAKAMPPARERWTGCE